MTNTARSPGILFVIQQKGDISYIPIMRTKVERSRVVQRSPSDPKNIAWMVSEITEERDGGGSLLPIRVELCQYERKEDGIWVQSSSNKSRYFPRSFRKGWVYAALENLSRV